MSQPILSDLHPMKQGGVEQDWPKEDLWNVKGLGWVVGECPIVFPRNMEQ